MKGTCEPRKMQDKKMSLIITRITSIKKLCQSSHLLLRQMLQPEAVATSLHESNMWVDGIRE